MDMDWTLCVAPCQFSLSDDTIDLTGGSLPCQHETSQIRSQIISESHMTKNCRRLQRIQICRKYRTMLLPYSLRQDCRASYYGTLPTIAGLREALRFGRSFLLGFCGSDHNRETFVVRVRQGHNGECRNFSHFYMYFMCFFMAYMLHVFLYIFTLSQPFEIKDRVLR